MKFIVFRCMTQFSLVEVCRHVEGSCRLHLHRVSPKRR